MEYRLPNHPHIVCSGRGLHLYYVFKKRSVAEYIKAIADAKTDLTRLWSSYVAAKWESLSMKALCRDSGSPVQQKMAAMRWRLSVGKKTIEYMNQLPADKQMTRSTRQITRVQAKAGTIPSLVQGRFENGEPRGHWLAASGDQQYWKEKIATRSCRTPLQRWKFVSRPNVIYLQTC